MATNDTAIGGSATVSVTGDGEAALVAIGGIVDERFAGFGELGTRKVLVVDVSRMLRMTSFGVRQWLKTINALPRSITDFYLLGCPTFFVDQLNMVLNFGGGAKVVSVVAPFTCPACNTETGELIDVLAERMNLAKGVVPDKQCARCGGKLELDETPTSYFAFASKYGAANLHPAAAALLAKQGLYASQDSAAEKPPRIIKLVHGTVTYFRIIGTVGSMFRARPFLVGAEGEVVIDVAEVERFDVAARNEWRRLLKTLAAQVPVVTLVDVTDSFLAHAGDTLALARNIAVASMLVRHRCSECGRSSHLSSTLDGTGLPTLAEAVCTTCGGATHSEITPELLVPLQKASTSAPPETVKVIRLRAELLSRARTDASVAQVGATLDAELGDEAILGKYKIVRKLSAGGMAEVFLAKQVGMGGFEKLVALKRIQHKMLESRRQAIELFLNEAKIAGRLTHPNIVQVLDVGEVGGALYLAMEYVHGKDLRDIAKQLRANDETMSIGEACYIAREVAQALHHAYWSTDMAGHRLSVVHRDVSPHNIILGYDGTVKLLDFGVAMSAVTEHGESLIVGKWMYMSPETTMTENTQTDHRSDLFSLGVILYLLCSGTMPFSGPDPKAIVKKIRKGEFTPLPEVAANVPPELAGLVARMLAPNPDGRPQKGEEVVHEINAIVRKYGIQSSASSIAALVASKFPPSEQLRVAEIVRSYPDDRGAATQRVDPSITPSAGTAHGGISVSEAFQRTTPTDLRGSAVLRRTPTSIPVAQPPAADRQLPVHHGSSVLGSVAKIVLTIAIVALLAAGAYMLDSRFEIVLP